MRQRIARIGLGLTLALGGSAPAAGQLNVVRWSGYFSPQL
ncbi:spermidine/putrescine ABC transporter substrate-binding protein, partial [Pseudomonas aeruginosa]|nr:spermidine/putrescine ABC transporter substrate-binding protein [Pseudomonas aeruginosa]